MAATVMITHVDQSKSGKTRVYFDGRNDWRDAYYIGNKCNGVPPVGAEIEPDTSSSVFHGNTTWFLNRFKLIKAPQDLASPAAASVAPSNGKAPIPQPPVVSAAPEPRQQALSSLYDFELRFISNVIGQAVYAMTIKEPGQIKPWFDACCDALSGGPKVIDRSAQTKKANEYATRLNDAIRAGNDSALLSIWNECQARQTGDEALEIAIWALLSTPVRNHIKDLTDRGEGDSMRGEQEPF